MYKVKKHANPNGLSEEKRECHGYFREGKAYKTKFFAALNECSRAVKLLWKDGKYAHAISCTSGFPLMLLEVIEESYDWLEEV